MKAQYSIYPHLMLALVMALLGIQFDMNAQGCTPPGSPAVTHGSRCGVGTTTLGATGDPGATLKWYAAATGGTSIGTGSVFTTPTVTTTTSFYVSAATVSTGSVALGAGASAGSAAPYNFADCSFGGAKCQYVYTAAELASAGLVAGNITSLTFSLTAAGSNLSGLCVQIGTTSISAFGGSANILGGLTTVYPLTTFVLAIGANTLNFSTPYNWDGVSNIIISISYSNVSFETSSSIRYDATPANSSQNFRDDNRTAANMAAFTGSVGSTSSGSYRVGKSRPAFRFNGAASCESSRVAVTASVITPPVLAISPSASVCTNVVKQLDVTSSLSDYDSYTWSPVSNLYTDAAATMPYAGGFATTVYYRSAGNSNQTYTVNASNSVSGCGAMATTTITAGIPVANASASPGVICSGSAVNLNVTGTSDLSWQWDPGAISGNSLVVNPVNAGTAMSVFSYTVTGTNAATSCSVNAVVSVSVNPLPGTPVAFNSSQCGFGIPTASVSGASMYKWYATPASTVVLQSGTSPTFTNSVNSSTTWYVDSYDASCVNNARTPLTVMVTPADAVNIAASQASACLGQSVVLAATTSGAAAYNYTWTASPGAGSGIPTSMTGASVTVTPATVGSYQYMAMANDGVCTTTAVVTVAVNSVPTLTATLNPNVICSGAPVNLEAATNIIVTGTVGLGTGSSLTSGSWGDPTAFSSYDKFYHTQAVYTAAELTAAGLRAGNITSITYSISTVGSYSTTTNYTVQCGSTTGTAFTDFIPTTGYTTVYSAASRTHTVGLNTIIFTTPYSWDGASNLVIDVRQDIGGPYTASTNSAKVYYTATTAKTMVHSTNNNVGSGGTASTKRLNLIFNGQVAGQGAGNLSWQWNPGAVSGNSVTVNPVNAGATGTMVSYTVTGTDPATSCTNTAAVSVSVNVMPSMPVTANSIQCGLGIPTASLSGGVNYRWYATQISTAVLQSGPDATYTTAINATTTWYVSSYNANCESARSAITVTVVPADAVTATSNSTAVCPGQSFQLGATQSGSTYQYTWTAIPSTGSGLPASVTGNTAIVTPVTPGTYQYMVTANNGVCTATASINVTLNDSPGIFTTSNPTVVCSGVPVTLDATATAVSTVGIGNGTNVTADADELTAFGNRYPSYHMQAVYTAAELNAAGLRAGNIRSIAYQISTAGSANNTTNYIVKIGTATAATLYSFLPATSLTTVYTAATQNHAVGWNTITFATPYNWDGVSNLVIDVSHNGINGGNNARTYYTVTSSIQQIYESGFVLGTTFNRLNIIFGGQAVVPVSGSLSWQWNPGAITSNSITVTPLNPGPGAAHPVYTITASDAVTSCTNSAVVTLTVYPIPSVTIAASTPSLCTGTSASLTATGATSYSWMPAGGSSSVAVVSPLFNTVYTVTGSSSGCSSTQTVSINVVVTPTITASASPSIICSGATANLSATGAPNYIWSPLGMSATSIVVSPTVSTVYTVTGENMGCTDTRTLGVTVNSAPTLTVSGNSSVLCTTGATATLTAVGTSTVYAWSSGASTASIIVTPTTTTNYTVSGSNSCGTSTAITTVSVATTPTISATTASSLICVGNTVALTASATAGASYLWNTGATTPSVSVSPVGTITYTVTGTNACGTATATVLQVVSPCTGIEEMGNEGEISMFPNPANDYIMIAIPASLATEGTRLEVTDALGKLVTSEVLNTDVTTVDLRKLEDGIYFFKVSSHNRIVKVGKVVKW